MKRILLLYFLSLGLSSLGQDTSVYKRTPYKLHIAVDNQTFYEEDIPAREFVYPNNSVQIYPGETIYLEAEVTDGKISKLRAVPAIVDSSKTITARFTQKVNRRTHEMMMLQVVNPFTKQLTYKAQIYILQAKRWIATSILPVMPGISGFETWPDVITTIALGNWELQ